MKTNDMPQFAALMTMLGELYEKKITEMNTEIYWNTLKHFELSDIKHAVSQHIADTDHGQFMPKPADIIRYIEGSSGTKALQAWASVISAIHRAGVYENVIFDDLLIHAVIQAMGGWVRLCLTERQNMPFRANEFQKYYMIFLKYPPNQILPYLSGMFSDSKPVRIADNTKTQKVLEEKSESSGTQAVLPYQDD